MSGGCPGERMTASLLEPVALAAFSDAGLVDLSDSQHNTVVKEVQALSGGQEIKVATQPGESAHAFIFDCPRCAGQIAVQARSVNERLIYETSTPTDCEAEYPESGMKLDRIKPLKSTAPWQRLPKKLKRDYNAVWPAL